MRTALSAALALFHQGQNFYCYKTLGAHMTDQKGVRGVRFAVWAPHALAVRLVGDFNGWQGAGWELERQTDAGVWVLFVPGLASGALYKYEIVTLDGQRLKADPFAFVAEQRPNSASIVAGLKGYNWRDDEWLAQRPDHYRDRPLNIYEVHLGSWQRSEHNEFLSYRQLAQQLPAYVASLGYTHLELLPLAEHPLDGSWGYQGTGYYALTSRYGTPADFMAFIDACHAQGLGVILDWVPGHFCNDDHGLKQFDGAPLFESEQPQQAENHQWGTTNFDLSRSEVQSFLIANALFWFEVYHIDGLRVDAVANLLYLDYGREPGQWQPNSQGGRENLAAVSFLQQLHTTVFEHYPAALMMAEESTAWPQVTAPVHVGGLGFNYKWNMGWMNDVLSYMATDPLYRHQHHDKLTFSLMYAFAENFVLPLSHDEVVHGKKALLDKMPGDYDQKFANLRLLYAYMIGHPGKKLLFMGGEFGQFREWDEATALDWQLLDYELHAKLHAYVAALNHYYLSQPCLWEQDCSWQGFSWINCDDAERSVLSFIRRDQAGNIRLFVLNFTPVYQVAYRVGVPQAGRFYEQFNSDCTEYGGSGLKNTARLRSEPIPWDQQQQSIVLQIPPLTAVVLAPTP